MTIAKVLYPKPIMSHTLKKVALEQVTYTPFAMVSFLFGMTLMEGKSIQDGVEEIEDKLWPTYKVGVVYWPIMQMINYLKISEKNRVPFLSAASLGWSTFLAWMKSEPGHIHPDHNSNNNIATNVKK
ncbi:hypothetical protein WDU94_000496 [Cyamophila willieti]